MRGIIIGNTLKISKLYLCIIKLLINFTQEKKKEAFGWDSEKNRNRKSFKMSNNMLTMYLEPAFSIHL